MAVARRAHHITALFRSVDDAVSAYQWLRALGFEEGQISVLLSDCSRDAFEAGVRRHHLESNLTSSTQAEASGAAGIAVGAGLFALAGVALSGLGLVVAGPLVAALAGGGVGAMVGPLVAGLVGYGFPEESAHAYEQALKQGGVALGVTPRDAEQARLVTEQFQALRGEHLITA